MVTKRLDKLPSETLKTSHWMGYDLSRRTEAYDNANSVNIYS